MKQKSLLLGLGVLVLVIVISGLVFRLGGGGQGPGPGEISVVDQERLPVAGALISVQTTIGIRELGRTDAEGLFTIQGHAFEGDPQFLLLGKAGHQDRIVPWPETTPAEVELARVGPAP